MNLFLRIVTRFISSTSLSSSLKCFLMSSSVVEKWTFLTNILLLSQSSSGTSFDYAVSEAAFSAGVGTFASSFYRQIKTYF